MSKVPDPWAVGVIIPAQNEASGVERCVASVLSAHGRCDGGGYLWIVVVADSCTDDTAGVARRALGAFGEVIECSVRSPGTARRLGADAVLAHFRGWSARRIWLANTDADSYVPVDWLRVHLEYAENGSTAVAGIVQLELLDDGTTDHIARVFHDTYAVDEDGTHTHVHGANLGVRADAYTAVGGWSHLTVAEDHCLWGRLKSGGWPSRSSIVSFVITSARLRGRACGGFADTLRARLDRASAMEAFHG